MEPGSRAGWGWHQQAHVLLNQTVWAGQTLTGVSVSRGLQEFMTIPSTEQAGGSRSWWKKGSHLSVPAKNN